MLDQLSDRITGALGRFRGKPTLTENNVQEAMREVRLSLLEADVHFSVVKDFIGRVREQALGSAVTKGVTPTQQFVKIVHDELTRTMGEAFADLDLKAKPPVVVMVVGLQGSGKTTTIGKLAKRLKDEGKSVMLVPADVYRPAAIEQLKTLAERVEVPCYDTGAKDKPVKIAKRSLKQAAKEFADVMLVDTAGRLHIDTELMDELVKMKGILDPREILLVADAMTGQDAVNVAKSFDETLDISGVILSKMDSDARGGAALSIHAVTGKPIKFVGMGEKLEALEPFHPDRIAGRILGMGDVVSLVEKAQDVVDQDEAEKVQKRLMKNRFSLEDFRFAIEQMAKMGDLESVTKMIPGMGGMMKGAKDFDQAEKELKKTKAMIDSMTPIERRNHQIINAKRRKRIAAGSGTSVQDVNRLIKQYLQMKKMMGKMQKMGMGKMMKQMGGMGGMPGGNFPGLPQ